MWLDQKWTGLWCRSIIVYKLLYDQLQFGGNRAAWGSSFIKSLNVIALPPYSAGRLQIVKQKPRLRRTNGAYSSDRTFTTYFIKWEKKIVNGQMEENGITADSAVFISV